MGALHFSLLFFSWSLAKVQSLPSTIDLKKARPLQTIPNFCFESFTSWFALLRRCRENGSNQSNHQWDWNRRGNSVSFNKALLTEHTFFGLFSPGTKLSKLGAHPGSRALALGLWELQADHMEIPVRSLLHYTSVSQSLTQSVCKAEAGNRKRESEAHHS